MDPIDILEEESYSNTSGVIDVEQEDEIIEQNENTNKQNESVSEKPVETKIELGDVPESDTLSVSSFTELPLALQGDDNEDVKNAVMSAIVLAYGLEARLPGQFYTKLTEELDTKVLLKLPPRLLTLVKKLFFECEELGGEIRDETMDELLDAWTKT